MTARGPAARAGHTRNGLPHNRFGSGPRTAVVFQGLLFESKPLSGLDARFARSLYLQDRLGEIAVPTLVIADAADPGYTEELFRETARDSRRAPRPLPRHGASGKGCPIRTRSACLPLGHRAGVMEGSSDPGGREKHVKHSSSRRREPRSGVDVDHDPAAHAARKDGLGPLRDRRERDHLDRRLELVHRQITYYPIPYLAPFRERDRHGVDSL